MITRRLHTRILFEPRGTCGGGCLRSLLLPSSPPGDRSIASLSLPALLLFLPRSLRPSAADSLTPPSILRFGTSPPPAAVYFPAAFLPPLAENLPLPQPDQTSGSFPPPQQPNSLPTPHRRSLFPSRSVINDNTSFALSLLIFKAIKSKQTALGARGVAAPPTRTPSDGIGGL